MIPEDDPKGRVRTRAMNPTTGQNRRVANLTEGRTCPNATPQVQGRSRHADGESIVFLLSACLNSHCNDDLRLRRDTGTDHLSDVSEYLYTPPSLRCVRNHLLCLSKRDPVVESSRPHGLRSNKRRCGAPAAVLDEFDSADPCGLDALRHCQYPVP